MTISILQMENKIFVVQLLRQCNLGSSVKFNKNYRSKHLENHRANRKTSSSHSCSMNEPLLRKAILRESRTKFVVAHLSSGIRANNSEISNGLMERLLLSFRTYFIPTPSTKLKEYRLKLCILFSLHQSHRETTYKNYF